jgi:hypothetical protein
MAKKNNWISVEEKLPAPYTTVLVWREHFFASTGYAAIDYVVKNMTSANCARPLWDGDLKSWKSCVTHWMPLPKPPVKKENPDG